MWGLAALAALALAEWSWTRVPAAGLKPAVRSGHAAVQVDGKVYVIGGCLLDVQCFNDVHVFDPASGAWTQLALAGDAPMPRGGHSATLVGASIFIFGGASPERAFNDAYELDLIARRWRRCVPQGPPPPARTGHAVDFDGTGSLLVFGGYSGDGQYLNDLWLLNVFHAAADTWEDAGSVPVGWTQAVTVGPTPSAREGHSLTVVRGRAFVYGGYTVSGLVPQDLHVLALDDLHWAPAGAVDPAPAPRQGHAAARHGDSLVVVGGCEVSPAQCYDDVWSLDTKSMTWTEQSHDRVTFSPREGHTATFVRGELIVIGGCELVSTCYNDVTVLDTGVPCPSSCGNGACSGDIAKGGAFCQCAPGYSGHDCLTPVPCPGACHSRGQCETTGRCACDNGFGGASCGLDFQCPKAGHAALPCSGQGRCGAGGGCSCYEGFTGTDCSGGAPACPAGCSGHGACTPESKCECNVGWSGKACDAEDACPLSCCGHGACGSTECRCDAGWHGPACSLGDAAWALLGKLGAQHAADLQASARAKRLQAQDVEEVAKLLTDGAESDAARAKAAALGVEAQTLTADAAALDAQAAAATKDPASSSAFGLATCSPDLNGIQPTSLSVETLGLVDTGLPPHAPPQSFARVLVKKVPPPIGAKPAEVADPKAFGVYENNDKVEVAESAICKEDCNYRGICKENVCYCEPSFYGEFCENGRTKKTGTLAVETVILIAGGCVVGSFALTMGFLQYTAMVRRQKEREMGFSI